jgi:hypothetical protein
MNYKAEIVDLLSLKPHPQNYRHHGVDQLEHIVASIKTHGIYRNVVAAKDGTILAGHGVVEALKKMGEKKVPIIRLDVAADDTRALKVLTGDNEIARLGEIDDRQLTEILRYIGQNDEEALIGTGFDEMMLANLVYVTRPSNEIEDFDAAREWVGLPVYDDQDETRSTDIVLEIKFKNEEDRDRFVAERDMKIGSTRGGRKWATTWPYIERNDASSVRFESAESEPASA